MHGLAIAYDHHPMWFEPDGTQTQKEVVDDVVAFIANMDTMVVGLTSMISYEPYTDGNATTTTNPDHRH